MKADQRLDREILASFERSEWKPVRNEKGEIAKLRAAAHKFVSGRLVETQKSPAARASRAGRKRTAA